MIEELVNGLPIAIQIIIFIISLAIGTLCLVKFCDIFLDSASLVAKKLKIAPFVIGLTIMAMGTSFPELAISVSDAISVLIKGGEPNIAYSNVLGSSIANLLLVLALSGLFVPIIVKKEVKKDYVIMIGVGLLLAVSTFLFTNDKFNGFALLRFEGIIFICLMISYIVYLILTNKKEHIEEDKEIANIKIGKPLILLILGLAGIILGGELVVFGAKGVALNISSALEIDNNLAETLIGLTIVAVGTSLPELVTTVMAAKKGNNEMALGNVIGSNIFNVLLVLGTSATILPFGISSYMIIDLGVMLAAFLIVLIFVLKGKIGKKESIIMLTLYASYIAYLIIRTII